MFRSITLAALLASAALPAAAADLCPSGDVPAIVRFSTITGTRAGFDKAVQDQILWYRSHGVTTNTIYESDVLAAPGAPPSNQVMTVHLNPPSLVSPTVAKRDAGFDAFVAEFKANSKIDVEKYVCMPK
jgi:hypothetical protein